MKPELLDKLLDLAATNKDLVKELLPYLTGNFPVQEVNSAWSTPELRIVILQRGWVMVGLFSRNGSDCRLDKASVIRIWGTTKGLGELAKNGPLTNTKLDKTNGSVEFDYLTVVATLACDSKVWENEI